MRGLCRLTAGLLTLARANTFVLPPDGHEAVDRLHDASPDTLPADHAVPPPNDDAGPDFGSIDFSLLRPHSTNNPTDHDEEKDFVQAWLDGLEAPETTSGSIFTSSLFPSMTFSSAIELVTATSEDNHRPVDPTSTRLSSPPAPTPLDLYPLGNVAQKPLGGFGETWRAAKEKAHSVVALIASHITNCPSSTKTQSPTEAVASVSSTISARTVNATPTGAPSKDDDEEHYSPVVVDAEASLLPPAASSNIFYESTFSSKVNAAPSGRPTQATPGHFMLSSGPPVPTATASFPAFISSHPSPSPAIEQQAQAESLTSAQDQPANIPATKPTDDSRYILAIVVPIVLTVILSCAIFHILIRRNPRRFADRLARYEERRTRRLYQCAAQRHRFETWTQKVVTRPPFTWFIRGSSADLAEKGLIESTTVTVPAPSGNRVSQEILSFREAHEFVSTLVQAEEGGWSSRDRRRTYMWLFSGRARRQRAMSNASSDLSDSEKTAPPPYEERENYEKIELMANTRMAREEAQDSDKSSVSSIIPTSPRQSTYTISTGDPDSDKE